VWIGRGRSRRDLVGRVIDRVDFEARGLQLFLGNHQLLHAACGGQFRGSALLVVLNAKEANEDDEHNHEKPGEVGNSGKVNGDQADLDGKRGFVLSAAGTDQSPVSKSSAKPTAVRASGINSRPASKLRFTVAEMSVIKTKTSHPPSQMTEPTTPRSAR